MGNNTPGKFFKAKYGGNAGKGPKTPGSAGRSGPAVRHNEGDAVGHGALAIGSENVGHKLLSKMGYVAIPSLFAFAGLMAISFVSWSQGDRIGLSGGLEAP